MPGRSAATVLEQVKAQIEAGKAELTGYEPASVDWFSRCCRTAEELVPWLQGKSAELIEYIEGVLNAPEKLRALWSEIKQQVELPPRQVEAFEKLLELEAALSRSLNGQVISSILTQRLAATAPAQLQLTMNVGNDFPDLYCGCGGVWSYSTLPKRKETGKAGGAKEFGAALVGDANRPVRVPDGLEVKTSPRTVKADCHYNHTGLHLVMVYRAVGSAYRVADLKVAFLLPGDYKERGRNTEASTVKFSFGGEKFISLLTQPVVTETASKARRVNQPGSGKAESGKRPNRKPRPRGESE